MTAQGPATGVLDARAIVPPAGTDSGAGFGSAIAAGVFHGHPESDPFKEPVVGAPGSGFVLWRGQTIQSPLPGVPLEQSFGRKIVTVDLDGDQSDEIVVAEPLACTDGRIRNGAIHIYSVELSGQLTAPVTIVGPYSTFEIGTHIARAGDVNADGFEDLIVSAFNFPYLLDGRLFAHRQPGSVFDIYEFRQPFPMAHLYEGIAAGVGDVDGDGFDDVALADVDHWPRILSGRTKQAIAQMPGPLRIGSFSGFHDLNGDGRPDVAVGETSGEAVHVYFTDPEGGDWLPIGPTHIAPWQVNGHRVLTGDFTGDGKAELALVPNIHSETIEFFSFGPGTAMQSVVVHRRPTDPYFGSGMALLDRAMTAEPGVAAEDRAPSLLINVQNAVGEVAEVRPDLSIPARAVRSFDQMPDFFFGGAAACETSAGRRARIHVVGSPQVGETLNIELDHGGAQRNAFLIAATRPALMVFPLTTPRASCLLLSGGGGVYDVAGYLTAMDGSVRGVDVHVPAAVVDTPIYLQWAILDPAAPNMVGVSTTPIHHLRIR